MTLVERQAESIHPALRRGLLKTVPRNSRGLLQAPKKAKSKAAALLSLTFKHLPRRVLRRLFFSSQTRQFNRAGPVAIFSLDLGPEPCGSLATPLSPDARNIPERRRYVTGLGLKNRLLKGDAKG